ncbi:MAG: aminoacyl-tRNA hydrolase [Candidatus Protistobacter heckmanni]|nr:aminoacyl-tRNA hydrolase [Candidatus Protistobacter heckmanni]
MIKLIAGLGNPGTEYEATRHNAGFWMVDQLEQRGNASLRKEKKFDDALTARAPLGRQQVWLLEPQKYMNLSGLAVRKLADFANVSPQEILVVHDELDLPPGAARLKFGGGTGGHNGLKDIARHLGTQDFWRLRLGIGHPRDALPPEARKGAVQDVAAFVLKPPRRDEMTLIVDAIDRSLSVMDDILDGQQEKAMLKLHSAA